MNVRKVIMRDGEDTSRFDLYDEHGKHLDSVSVNRDDDSANAGIKIFEQIFNLKVQIKSEDEE